MSRKSVYFLWLSWGHGSEWTTGRSDSGWHIHLGRLWITAFVLL